MGREDEQHPGKDGGDCERGVNLSFVRERAEKSAIFVMCENHVQVMSRSVNVKKSMIKQTFD